MGGGRARRGRSLRRDRASRSPSCGRRRRPTGRGSRTARRRARRPRPPAPMPARSTGESEKSIDTPCSGLSREPWRSSQRPSQPGAASLGDQAGLPEVARVEVREVGVRVVDARQEADLAGLEQALHAAVQPARPAAGAMPRPVAPSVTAPIQLECRAQVGVGAELRRSATIVSSRSQPPGRNTATITGRVGRGGRLRPRRPPGSRVSGIAWRPQTASAGAQAARRSPGGASAACRASGRAGRARLVEVVAGAVERGHQWSWASGPDEQQVAQRRAGSMSRARIGLSRQRVVVTSSKKRRRAVDRS